MTDEAARAAVEEHPGQDGSSEISVDRPLGTPEDLQAHAHLLDGTSGVAPVLPLRFGAVMTDDTAVEEELLAAHADEFAAALQELEGRRSTS